MQVILLQDVDKLGAEGEIVTVKNGFGRNYLIPRGLARLATDGVVKARQEEVRQQSRKRAQQKEQAENMARQLENTEVVVRAKTGEENRIFGTVTPTQVADRLTVQGFNIDRRNITLLEEIRMLGVYTAAVKLHPEVTAQVKIRVEPEVEEEA